MYSPPTRNHMTQLFQSEATLRARFQAVSRELGFRATTLDEWRFWRQALRAKIRELQGIDRLTPTALNPRLTETVRCDGYTRQRVEIDTEPGVTMPLYVLIPEGLSGTAPGVIAAHGHSSGGKLSPAGVRDNPLVRKTIEDHNYDYGVQAVRRGY